MSAFYERRAAEREAFEAKMESLKENTRRKKDIVDEMIRISLASRINPYDYMSQVKELSS